MKDIHEISRGRCPSVLLLCVSPLTATAYLSSLLSVGNLDFFVDVVASHCCTVNWNASIKASNTRNETALKLKSKNISETRSALLGDFSIRDMEGGWV